MGTMGHVQANTSMRVLGRLLSYAADNLQSPDGQPFLLMNPGINCPLDGAIARAVFLPTCWEALASRLYLKRVHIQIPVLPI